VMRKATIGGQQRAIEKRPRAVGVTEPLEAGADKTVAQRATTLSSSAKTKRYDSEAAAAVTGPGRLAPNRPRG
jgi:hypothetical protein